MGIAILVGLAVGLTVVVLALAAYGMLCWAVRKLGG